MKYQNQLSEQNTQTKVEKFLVSKNVRNWPWESETAHYHLKLRATR